MNKPTDEQIQDAALKMMFTALWTCISPEGCAGAIKALREVPNTGDVTNDRLTLMIQRKALTWLPELYLREAEQDPSPPPDAPR